MIFHITTKTEAIKGKGDGSYVPTSLSEVGFIHCSYAAQVARVANALFARRTDLVLLEIKRSNLPCDVVDEDLYGAGELFPHIYGPLPWEAVVAFHEFACGENGTFQWRHTEDE